MLTQRSVGARGKRRGCAEGRRHRCRGHGGHPGTSSGCGGGVDVHIAAGALERGGGGGGGASWRAGVGGFGCGDSA